MICDHTERNCEEYSGNDLFGVQFLPAPLEMLFFASEAPPQNQMAGWRE